MILSFNPRFIVPILNGTKIHTIRADPNNRWHRGIKIHMATGIRTKKYHCFDEAICNGTQGITIEHDVHAIGDTVICVQDRVLSLAETETLARNDGFENLADFYKWFNKTFVGKIIHFTNFRY